MVRSEREGPLQPSKEQLEWRGHEPYFRGLAVFRYGITHRHDRDVQKLLATIVPTLVEIAESGDEGNKMINVVFKGRHMNEDLLPNSRPVTPIDDRKDL